MPLINTDSKIKNLLSLIKILLIALPVVIFFFAVYKNLALSGKVVYETNLQEKDPFISNLGPSNRVSDPLKNLSNGEKYQSMFVSPAIFNLKLVDKFDTAKIIILYDSSSPTLQLRYLDKTSNTRSETITLEDTTLYGFSIPENYEKITNGDLTLMQRDDVRQFNNVEEFLADIPLNENIAELNYNLSEKIKLEGFSPEGQVSIDYPLRGPHSFYTYVKDSPLHLNLKYYDGNSLPGPDDIHMKLYFGDEIMIENSILDEDREEDPTVERLFSSPPEITDFIIPNLPEGCYRIEINTSYDIVFSNISLNLPFLVFEDKFRADSPFLEYVKQNQSPENIPTPEDAIESPTPENISVFLFTNNQEIRTRFDENETDKKYIFNEIDQTEYDKYFYVSPPMAGISKIESTPSVSIETDGMIFLSEDQFFFPPTFINPLTTQTDFEKTSYIISSFKIPTYEGKYKVGEATFDLSTINSDFLEFQLIAPNLSGNPINVFEIQAKLEKNQQSLSHVPQKIFNFLKYYSLEEPTKY